MANIPTGCLQNSNYYTLGFFRDRCVKFTKAFQKSTKNCNILRRILKYLYNEDQQEYTVCYGEKLTNYGEAKSVTQHDYLY